MAEPGVPGIIELLSPLIEAGAAGGHAISGGTPLLSTGLIDSFSVAELAEILSEAYGIRIGIEELGVDNADTPDQLFALVTSKAAKS